MPRRVKKKASSFKSFFKKRLGAIMAIGSVGVLGSALLIYTMAAPSSVTSFVNPFIGTAGGGNVFPGAVYPHGMIQWSPDNKNSGGTSYDYNTASIHHFALTNFSGRGCASHQDVGIMPAIGPIGNPVHLSDYYENFSHSNEHAEPGIYKVTMSKGITVELSTTARSGFGKFTYPAVANGEVMINANSSAHGNITPEDVHIDVANRLVTGRTTTTTSCGSLTYTVYFAVYFDRAFKGYGTWSGSTKQPLHTSVSGTNSGAYIDFDATSNHVVQVKTGISYVSIANAEDNVAKENTTWNVADVETAARNAWQQKLGQIQVAGGSTADKTTFYTAVYHTLIHPSLCSDANGQYLGFDHAVHTAQGSGQYSNIPGWDEYRTLFPLRALLEPNVVGDMVQSMVNDANQDSSGGLPRWEIANANSGGMEGDPYDDVISTAYAFGVRNFNATDAYKAMLKGATVPGTKSSGNIVREGLSDYLSKGYIASSTDNYSGSKTVQYSIDDFSIAQFANALGKTSDYNTFMARSHNWQHLFHNGRLMIRGSDGSWSNQGSGATSGWREGTNSQYIWMSSQDLPALAAKLGGNAVMNSQLDNFFSKLNDGTSSQYAYMGNEPGEVMPYDYVFSGAPYKSQSVVRKVETQLFKNTTGGLPGNDDAGSLSSWYVLSALGLFPSIQGLTGVVLTTPLFPSVSIALQNGKLLTINAANASDSNTYIQSATVNSTAYNTNPWINFGSIQNGGTITVTTASTPNTSWGTQASTNAPVVQ